MFLFKYLSIYHCIFSGQECPFAYSIPLFSQPIRVEHGYSDKQIFELLSEHRFSPNNIIIHAFTTSEPCILPIFCKAIQAPKTLIYTILSIYICLIVIYLYIYMYIFNVNIEKTLSKIFTLTQPHPTPLFHGVPAVIRKSAIP